MADNANSTVYVGNLDERISERVLYDILIQAGRVVDLYMPRDKETNKLKGFAFAEYETEEVAAYAVKLFSGLIILYKKTLKFAISGKDKPSMNLPALNSSLKPKSHPVPYEMGVSPNSMKLSTPCRFPEQQVNYPEVLVTPGVSVHHPNGNRSNYDDYNYEHSNGYRSPYDNYNYEHSNRHRSPYGNYNYDYSRRVVGEGLDNIAHSSLGRYNTRDSTGYYNSY